MRKSANITPIHKDCDRERVENYRGISLQSLGNARKDLCIMLFTIKLLVSCTILITDSSLVAVALLNCSWYIMMGSKFWTRATDNGTVSTSCVCHHLHADSYELISVTYAIFNVMHAPITKRLLSTVMMMIHLFGTYFVVHITCTNRLTTFTRESTSQPILEDPGATSRDDAIFSGESLLPELKIRLGTYSVTEPVPEVVEHLPTDWPEKYFSAQSARRSSRVTLSPSYT